VDMGVKKKGRLVDGNEPNPMPYEHGIATYALGEATTFCKQLGQNIPRLEEVTQQAGQFIIDNQHTKTGGWEYGYSEDKPRGGDLSVTGWQIQALKACKHTGLDFRGLNSCIKKALDYVEECQVSGGGFSYVHSKPTTHAKNGYYSLTGAGMLCLQMWDKENSAAVRQGAAYITKNSKFEYNGPDCDLYAHYYEAQAMINRGGPDWKKYNDMFRDQLLNNQANDGSWKKPGGGKPVNGPASIYLTNTHYRTCLAILMLETYYRFLPGTGGK
ncbi:MAG: hypothetical protein WBG04_19670, partial [Haloferula sp.]